MGKQIQSQQKGVSSSTKKQTKFKERPTTTKIFETAEEAALAYDEAACLLRGSNTRTNFATPVFTNSNLSLKIRNLLNHKKSLKQSSPATSNTTTINTKANIKPSTIVSTNSSFGSDSSINNDIFLSNSSDGSFLYNGIKQDGLIFDDAYKPDLSSCIAEIESSTSQFDHSWPFPTGFDPLPFAQEGVFQLPKHVGLFPDHATDVELSEFERMKVERQISASLYAVNGVNDYLENTLDPSHAVWDFPPLSQTSLFFSQCYEF